MKRQAINIIKYVLFLAIGIALFVFAFRGHDVGKMYEEIKGANFNWIFLSLFFSVLAYISRAYRWILLIEPLGYKPKLKNTLNAVIIGYLANLALPRVGEITRCATLNQLEKIPINPLIGTVIIERVVDVLILVLSMLLVFLLNITLFGSFFYQYLLHPIHEKLLNFSPLALILVFTFIFILVFLLYKIKLRGSWMSKALEKMKKFLLETLEGIKSIGKMRNKASFIFHSFFIWFMYFLMTYVCFFAIPSTSHLGPVDGLFVMVSGGLGMTAPVQGGIGAYHWIVSESLTLLNVTIDQGLIFATLVHTSQLFLTLFLGLIALISMFISNTVAKKQNGQT